MDHPWGFWVMLNISVKIIHCRFWVKIIHFHGDPGSWYHQFLLQVIKWRCMTPYNYCTFGGAMKTYHFKCTPDLNKTNLNIQAEWLTRLWSICHCKFSSSYLLPGLDCDQTWSICHEVSPWCMHGEGDIFPTSNCLIIRAFILFFYVTIHVYCAMQNGNTLWQVDQIWSPYKLGAWVERIKLPQLKNKDTLILMIWTD